MKNVNNIAMNKTQLKVSFVILIMLALMSFTSGGKSNSIVTNEILSIYLNTAYSFDERETDLVSRLTLEEKQSLLGNKMAAIPRLGIKAYRLG